MHYVTPSTSLWLPSPSRGERYWLLAIGLLTLPFLVYLFVVARRAHISARFDVPHPKGFGLIIDASPAGSRFHVFEFLNEGWIPFIGLDGKGLVSAGAARVRGKAGESEGFARWAIGVRQERIPKAEWKATTTINLIDSRAVRGLKVEVSSAILNSCQRRLRGLCLETSGLPP